MIRKFILLVMVLAALGAAGLGLTMFESYRGFQGDTYVKLERGTGTAGIARALQAAGVIRFTWPFILEHELRRNAKLQAGEYRFAGPETVPQVFDRIARGDVYYFDFTVPEGNNMFDIATSLESAGVMAAADFLQAAEDPKLIHDLAPEAKSLEGFLFPSTYRLSHWVTAPDLCKQMVEQFRHEWKKLAPGRAPSTAMPVVTLASLVEKETGVAAERPLVAGVFTNRLNKGMRLECDPTTIYAALLENRYRNAIHKSDLASQNPYNTYQHTGLPPGPIANPGAASLTAALAPAETDYLFFVAKADGSGHQFSSTLAAHQKATKEYRNGQKKRKAG